MHFFSLKFLFVCLLYQHILRTEFRPSLAHWIVFDHDQTPPSVPASPEVCRKCEKGVIMAPTECLLDKRKSFHSIHTNILSAVWLFQCQQTLQPTDKATCHLTPGCCTWQCHLVKQKDNATYRCTVFHLLLHGNQIWQIIP